MEEDSLKSINKEYAALIEEYLGKIKDKATGVLLFGSVARGEELPFPRSDIDLIVITKELPSDFFERAEMVRKIEDSPSLLQSIWMTEDEFIGQFKDRGFLKNIIPEAKRELKERGIKRVGSAWVWPVKRAGEVFDL